MPRSSPTAQSRRNSVGGALWPDSSGSKARDWTRGRLRSARTFRTATVTPGFQPTGLVFPTDGCWRVVGSAAGARLAFVVLGTKRCPRRRALPVSAYNGSPSRQPRRKSSWRAQRAGLSSTTPNFLRLKRPSRRARGAGRAGRVGPRSAAGCRAGGGAGPRAFLRALSGRLRPHVSACRSGARAAGPPRRARAPARNRRSGSARHRCAEGRRPRRLLRAKR
jgi:hypothetical protein